MRYLGFFIGIAGIVGLAYWGRGWEQGSRAKLCLSLEQLSQQGQSAEELDLSRQPFAEFPLEVFGHSGLKRLVRRGNLFSASKMERLRRDSALTPAEWEQLLAFKLTALHPDVGNLSRLEELDLRDNLLSALPERLGDLEALRVLTLSGNRLESLPAGLGKLGALVQLDAADNRITALPPDWSRCQALQEVRLERNLLSDCSALTACKGLLRLDLSHNALQTLPGECSAWQSLTELSLSHNALTALPPGICRLAALTDLDLSHNALTALPDSIALLQGLQFLHLGGNPLQPAERSRICQALPRTKVIF